MTSPANMLDIPIFEPDEVFHKHINWAMEIKLL